MSDVVAEEGVGDDGCEVDVADEGLSIIVSLPEDS